MVVDPMLRKQIVEFDDAFPDGVFAFTPGPNEPKVKIRALGEYCKRMGLKPSEISQEVMELFLVRDIKR